MVNELDTRLVLKESGALDEFVDLTKDYSDDIITLSAAHIEDAKHGKSVRFIEMRFLSFELDQSIRCSK